MEALPGQQLSELGTELKAVTTELEQLESLGQVSPAIARKTSRETVEQRVERIRVRLGHGGEIAQGIVRDISGRS